MIELKFETCKWSKLAEYFGLERVKELPLLTEWTDFQTVFIERELQALRQIRSEAHWRGHDMNEDEVMFRLIAPITWLGNFPVRPYTVFNARPLTAQIGEYQLTGLADFMLALGAQEPYEQFFFLQEYKPAQLPNSDPLGQVLSAMLAAQYSNGEAFNHPVFGAMVLSTTWNFIVLDGKQFAVSPGYDVDSDDIFRVPAILRGVNYYVRQWLGLPPL